MNESEIKSAVESAVGKAWAAFSAEHPALAATLDRRVAIERTTQSLSNSPEFQEAITRAEAAALAMKELTSIVEQIARSNIIKWMLG